MTPYGTSRKWIECQLWQGISDVPDGHQISLIDPKQSFTNGNLQGIVEMKFHSYAYG